MLFLTFQTGFWNACHKCPAKRVGFAVLLAVILSVLTDISSAELDKALVQMVTETIQSNFDKIKSYEAEYQIESFDALPIQGKNYPLKQNITAHVWHDAPKWRNEIKTQILSFADKENPKVIDATITALFDGEKTTIHHTSGDSGRISAGDHFGEEITGKYLRNIFTAFGIDIRTDLHKADSLAFVEEKIKGTNLLKAHFNFAPEGTVDIYLNPDNAFHIQFAEAKDMKGELRGTHRSTKFIHIPGTPKVSVFVLGMSEEIYDADHSVMKSEKLEGTIKIDSINQPCPQDVFVYEFPGGTLLKDEIKGTNRVIPFIYEIPDNSRAKSRIYAIITISVLFTLIFFILRYWLRRRSKK